MTTGLSSVTAAAAAAESAINIGIMTVLATTPNQNVKFPLRCRMPGGERVTVTLEQEAGKVDLNTATPAILASLFTALTYDQSMGTRIAGRILEFRDRDSARSKDTAPQAPSNKSDIAGKTGFATIMQLDQIEGISPRLFRTALRFVTVRSGRAEPVAEAASPALRDALNLDQKPAVPTLGPPVNGSVTFRADVRTLDGTRFIREALISLGENGRPFLVREWRRGDIDSIAPSVTSGYQDHAQMPESNCFRIVESTGN